MEERGLVVAVQDEVGARRGPFIAAGKAVTSPDFELEELRAMAVGEKNIPQLTRPVRFWLGFVAGSKCGAVGWDGSASDAVVAGGGSRRQCLVEATAQAGVVVAVGR
jgi:hypothetical protein